MIFRLWERMKEGVERIEGIQYTKLQSLQLAMTISRMIDRLTDGMRCSHRLVIAATRTVV